MVTNITEQSHPTDVQASYLAFHCTLSHRIVFHRNWHLNNLGYFTEHCIQSNGLSRLPNKSLSFWGYPVPRFLWFREPDHQKRLQNEGLLYRNTQTNTFNIFIHDLDSILSRFANNTKPGVADKPDGCTAFSGNLTVWKNEQTWISQSLYGKCKYEYPHSPVQAGTNCLESSLKEKKFGVHVDKMNNMQWCPLVVNKANSLRYCIRSDASRLERGSSLLSYDETYLERSVSSRFPSTQRHGHNTAVSSVIGHKDD